MHQVQKLLLDDATLQEGNQPTIQPTLLLDQYGDRALRGSSLTAR